MLFFRGLGKMIMKKIWSKKFCDIVPLKSVKSLFDDMENNILYFH